MRKLLLAGAGGATGLAGLLLLLAAFDVERGVLLPLGIAAALVGVQSMLGVILLGQRVVMVRTSAIARAMGANPNPSAGPTHADDDTVAAVEKAMQSLAWSVDARLVGMMEHLSARDDVRTDG